MILLNDSWKWGKLEEDIGPSYYWVKNSGNAIFIELHCIYVQGLLVFNMDHLIGITFNMKVRFWSDIDVAE